ncbi:hypothetical protein HPP92_012185 [Vanilla planifolia]|uniref:Uncharacterized protein n=1 Tax=Vanilla planifolia TaxID=51239 RepID=A0A835R210_VANPL|nr:hypothetical protein HPP92_012185 [Vanilla planifolia]
MSEAATNDAYIGRLLRFCFERSPSSMLRLFRGRESCNNACTVDLVASDKEEVDIVACVDEKSVDVAIIVVDNDSTSLGYFFTVLEAILDVDAANNCMWRQLPPNIMVMLVVGYACCGIHNVYAKI